MCFMMSRPIWIESGYAKKKTDFCRQSVHGLILTAWDFYAKQKRITHLCNDVQVRVCNYASHLNNLVLFDIQPCHLKQEEHWHFKTSHSYNCTITADDIS